MPHMQRITWSDARAVTPAGQDSWGARAMIESPSKSPTLGFRAGRGRTQPADPGKPPQPFAPPGLDGARRPLGQALALGVDSIQLSSPSEFA
jgi:hypothetical protein